MNGVRKTAPKVRDGQVARKNRDTPTPNVFNSELSEVLIEREQPGPGFRHLLLKRDVKRFIELLPDWDELSTGLNAIVLARGLGSTDGWHHEGVVGICAWERELWRQVDEPYVSAHSALFERLGVPVTRTGAWWRLEFTESTARAYQLLHILLHELGHHRDLMTTRSRRASRGEVFAERYALEHEAQIWDRFMAEFGQP